jgi:diguanylate cyclase
MSLTISNKNVPLQALLKRFALIYLPIVIVLSILILSGIRSDEQNRVERIAGREASRIEVARGRMTQELSEVNTHLRIIANLHLLGLYLDTGNPAQREELAKIFLLLSREARFYDQVRYLDVNGQEVIRINYNDGKPTIVPREQLQNKSGRYYFDDTIKLNQGEIFISPLDLNIENGRLEIPQKPTIRFGTPVFDSMGRKKGVILLNYLGGELLQHFREVMQGGDPHSGMLLNRDGYWLSSTKREDEWGFMLHKSERTFGRDFATEWRAISATERGTLRTAQGLFLYTTVYPLLRGQHSSAGSAMANAPSKQEVSSTEYYWKIVSFVPVAVLSGTAFYNQTSSRILFVIIYLLLALGAFIVALVTLNRKRAEEALQQSEEELRQMVYHDTLTGLPNRKLFSDRLGIALAQARRNQKEVGIAMLDLDKFKAVNDTLGHDVGDLLLKATAGRLSAALRNGDTVARFGGDEFLLILPDLKTIEDAIQVAQKIVDGFRKPFLIDPHQLVVTTSIGIAVFPHDGIDEVILLKNADIAMYQAKQAGGGRYQLCQKS